MAPNEGNQLTGNINMRTFMKLALATTAVAFGLVGPANAGNILIINGISATSEVGTTNSITTQLSTLHTAAGNVVTVVDTVPVNFTGFQQVWDIRFSTTGALAAGTITQYVNYLASGGGMFVMGENSGFAARNASVIALVGAAGGGALTFTTPGDTQTVFAPFTGPNAVATVNYLAAGGVTTFGSGQWITANANGGTGVAFGVGSLSNATAGALTAIFDVNFMQTDANAGSVALTKNLIGFVGNQVNPVPEPATWGMMLVGFGIVGGAMRRRQRTSLSFG
jgi:hypothetical protein